MPSLVRAGNRVVSLWPLSVRLCSWSVFQRIGSGWAVPVLEGVEVYPYLVSVSEGLLAAGFRTQERLVVTVAAEVGFQAALVGKPSATALMGTQPGALAGMDAPMQLERAALCKAVSAALEAAPVDPWQVGIPVGEPV